jgi:hypothetical protein
MVPFGLSMIIELFVSRAERTRSDLMKERFPNVGEIGIDQSNRRLIRFPKALAKLGSQLQSTCTATHNNNLMFHEVALNKLEKGIEKKGGYSLTRLFADERVRSIALCVIGVVA